MAYIKGVDVSSFQPEHFDTSGSSFAFIKATQSTNYINPLQNAQTAWSRSKGLVTGFYHFLEKGNIQAQAEYFVTKCASVEGDLLACDWETDPSSKTYASAAEKEQFIKAVKKLRPTHKVGLYCNKSFWTSIDKDSYCGDFLWIAAPGTAGSPGIQHAWTFHQYSISGSMDRNIASFSTKAELANWAGSGTDDDVALTSDDINKIADAVFSKLVKTDGVFNAPSNSPDYKTNKFWAFQTHVEHQTVAALESAANTESILSALKALPDSVWSYPIANPARPDASGNPSNTPASSFQRSEDSHYDALNAKLDVLTGLLQDPAGFLAQLKAELSKVDITLKVND